MTDKILDNMLVEKLNKDLRFAAKSLSTTEVAILVKNYYSVQEARLKANAQTKAAEKAELPTALSGWLTQNFESFESYISKLLDHYSMTHPVGKWARGQLGIGPVIASALIANIDCHKAQTAGAVWRFCGLVPGQRRVKGQKIDWSPEMKQIAYYIGESFVKVSGNPKAFYGQVYRQRKEYETKKNEAGDYNKPFTNRDGSVSPPQVQVLLESKRFDGTKEAIGHLKAGHLPPFLIDRRAKRYAAKLFLAHFFEVLYKHTHDKEPPLPYPIAHLGHVHKIEVPNAAE